MATSILLRFRYINVYPLEQWFNKVSNYLTNSFFNIENPVWTAINGLVIKGNITLELTVKDMTQCVYTHTKEMHKIKRI